MAIFNARSKMFSLFKYNPTLLVREYGLPQKQPKASLFLLDPSPCCSFSTDIFRSTLQRIPYSGKFCFVSPERVESTCDFLPEKEFREYVNKNFKWGLLPSSDPRVTLVESVAKKLIDAVNEGLMLEEAYKINGNVHQPPPPKTWEQTTLVWKPETGHLNGREWEFYVAENMPYYSRGTKSGKIIISAKLLEGNVTASREAIIATAVAYEIGKVVGKKHWRLKFMAGFLDLVPKCMLLASVIFVGITEFLILLPVTVLFVILLERFHMRRTCAEAARTGLIVMASAAYPPWVVPAVYMYFGGNKSGMFSTYYSGGEIGMLLSEKDVMGEAKEIYEAAKAGKVVTKFV